MTDPPNVDNLIHLLEQRDLDTAAYDDLRGWSHGRGVVTTDEVRRALLGDDTYADRWAEVAE